MNVVPPPNSYVNALIPKVMVYRGRPLANNCHEGGVFVNGISVLIRRHTTEILSVSLSTPPPSSPCEDTERG